MSWFGCLDMMGNKRLYDECDEKGIDEKKSKDVEC